MKIVGLILQIFGIFILGFSVCLDSAKKYINFEWKQVPCEIKVFCFFLGITNRNKYLNLFGGNSYPHPEWFTLWQRLTINLPIFGLAFAVMGTLLTVF